MNVLDRIRQLKEGLTGDYVLSLSFWTMDKLVRDIRAANIPGDNYGVKIRYTLEYDYVTFILKVDSTLEDNVLNIKKVNYDDEGAMIA